MGNAKPPPAHLLAIALVWAGLNTSAEALGRIQDAPVSTDIIEPLTAAEIGLFDVFFGGENLGAHIVEFDGIRFRFDTPEAVIEALPLDSPDPSIGLFLSGLIDRNSQRACQPGQRRSQCGTLQPERFAAILDVSIFRIEIFINASLLPGAEAGNIEYLAPQSATFSGVLNNRLFLSGESDGDVEATLSTNGHIALAGGRLETRFTSGTEAFRLDALTYAIDLERRRVSAGVVAMDRLPVVGVSDLLGVQIRSAFERVRNRSELFAEPLDVFLTRRSRVEIYREGRLLHAATYDAGNQFLDTSGLPMGSYPVTLRILDPVSGPIEEERFFVNRQGGGPIGETTFVAELGYGRTRGLESLENTVSDTPVGRFGLSRRLSSQFRVYADAAATNEEQVLAGGFDYGGSQHRLRVGGIATADGAAGFQAFVTTRLGATAFSVSARSLDAASAAPGSFGLVRGGFESYSASVIRPVGPATAGLRTRYNRFGTTSDADWSINPYFRWPLGSVFGARIDLTGEADWTGDERSVVFRIALSRPRARSSFGGDSVARFRRDRIENQDDFEAEVRAYGSVRGTRAEIGRYTMRVDGLHAGDGRSAALEAALRNDAGVFAAAVNASSSGGRETVRYSGSANVGLAFNARGWALMGDDIRRSAALVSVRGLPEGSFDVVLDGANAGNVSGSGRRAIPLRPYREHTVSLIPTGETIAAFDDPDRVITTYPGRVDFLEWQVYPVVLFVSQIVDSAGLPVGRARVFGGTGVGLTDSQGFLQVEARPGAQLTLRRANGIECQLDLPATTDGADERAIRVIDTLICR